MAIAGACARQRFVEVDPDGDPLEPQLEPRAGLVGPPDHHALEERDLSEPSPPEHRDPPAPEDAALLQSLMNAGSTKRVEFLA